MTTLQTTPGADAGVPLEPSVRLIDEAAKRAGCTQEEIEWYSWPQVFGSTVGPGGGIGGQTATVFQVYAFSSANGQRMKWCAGKWRSWNGEFCGQW